MFQAHDKGTDGVVSIHDEGQGGCSTKVKILGPCMFSVDVDLEGRVR